MDWPEIAGKHKNPATQVCGCRRLRWPDPATGRKILMAWSSGCPNPPSPARVQ